MSTRRPSQPTPPRPAVPDRHDERMARFNRSLVAKLRHLAGLPRRRKGGFLQ